MLPRWYSKYDQAADSMIDKALKTKKRKSKDEDEEVVIKVDLNVKK